MGSRASGGGEVGARAKNRRFKGDIRLGVRGSSLAVEVVDVQRMRLGLTKNGGLKGLTDNVSMRTQCLSVPEGVGSMSGVSAHVGKVVRRNISHMCEGRALTSSEV